MLLALFLQLSRLVLARYSDTSNLYTNVILQPVGTAAVSSSPGLVFTTAGVYRGAPLYADFVASGTGPYNITFGVQYGDPITSAQTSIPQLNLPYVLNITRFSAVTATSSDWLSMCAVSVEAQELPDAEMQLHFLCAAYSINTSSWSVFLQQSQSTACPVDANRLDEILDYAFDLAYYDRSDASPQLILTPVPYFLVFNLHPSPLTSTESVTLIPTTVDLANSLTVLRFRLLSAANQSGSGPLVAFANVPRPPSLPVLEAPSVDMVGDGSSDGGITFFESRRLLAEAPQADTPLDGNSGNSVGDQSPPVTVPDPPYGSGTYLGSVTSPNGYLVVSCTPDFYLFEAYSVAQNATYQSAIFAPGCASSSFVQWTSDDTGELFALLYLPNQQLPTKYVFGTLFVYTNGLIFNDTEYVVRFDAIDGNETTALALTSFRKSLSDPVRLQDDATGDVVVSAWKRFPSCSGYSTFYCRGVLTPIAVHADPDTRETLVQFVLRSYPLVDGQGIEFAENRLGGDLVFLEAFMRVAWDGALLEVYTAPGQNTGHAVSGSPSQISGHIVYHTDSQGRRYVLSLFQSDLNRWVRGYQLDNMTAFTFPETFVASGDSIAEELLPGLGNVAAYVRSRNNTVYALSFNDACQARITCTDHAGVPSPAGYFSPNGTTIPCKDGEYCPVGTADPLPCPDGAYCLVGFQYPCPEGFTCNATAVVGPCPPGYACFEGQKARPVPPSTYSAVLDGRPSVQICPSGFVCPGEPGENIRVVAAGYYAPLAASVAYPCPPSMYCPEGSTHPMLCPPSKYCPAMSKEPRKCPPGTRSPWGAPSKNHCITSGVRETVIIFGSFFFVILAALTYIEWNARWWESLKRSLQRRMARSRLLGWAERTHKRFNNMLEKTISFSGSPFRKGRSSPEKKQKQRRTYRIISINTIIVLYSCGLLTVNFVTDILSAKTILQLACEKMPGVHAPEFPGLTINYKGRLADYSSFQNKYYSYAHCKHFACFTADDTLYCSHDGFHGLAPDWGLDDPRLKDSSYIALKDDRGLTNSMDSYSLLGCSLAPGSPVFQILDPAGLGLDSSLYSPTQTFARRGSILCLRSVSDYARPEPGSNTILRYTTGGQGNPIFISAESQAHFNETSGQTIVALPRLNGATGQVVRPLTYTPDLLTVHIDEFRPLDLRRTQSGALTPTVVIDQTIFGFLRRANFTSTELYELATDLPFQALKNYLDKTISDPSAWVRQATLASVIICSTKEVVKAIIFIAVLLEQRLKGHIDTELVIRNPLTIFYFFVRFVQKKKMLGGGSLVPEEESWKTLVLDSIFEHIPSALATVGWMVIGNTIGQPINVISLFFTLLELTTTLHRISVIFLFEFSKGVEVFCKPYKELGESVDSVDTARRRRKEKDVLLAMYQFKEAVRASRLRYRIGRRLDRRQDHLDTTSSDMSHMSYGELGLQAQGSRRITTATSDSGASLSGYAGMRGSNDDPLSPRPEGLFAGSGPQTQGVHSSLQLPPGLTLPVMPSSGHLRAQAQGVDYEARKTQVQDSSEPSGSGSDRSFEASTPGEGPSQRESRLGQSSPSQMFMSARGSTPGRSEAPTPTPGAAGHGHGTSSLSLGPRPSEPF